MKKSTILLALLALFLVGATSLQEEEDYPWRDHEPPFDYTFDNMIDTHQQSRVDNDKKNKKLHGFLYIHYTGDTQDGVPVAEKADCPSGEECQVGWILKGIPIEAKLLKKGPRVWLVSPDDLPKEPGYTHFQWIGDPYSPSGLEIEATYSGILMKRVAPASFFWLGGSGSDGGGGGCGGHESDSGDTHDEGGCDGHDDGSGGSGGNGGNGGSNGHGGRLVSEGVDDQSNIVTSPDEIGPGGCGGHDDGGCDGGDTDDGGCSGDDGGCDGHDSGA